MAASKKRTPLSVLFIFTRHDPHTRPLKTQPSLKVESRLPTLNPSRNNLGRSPFIQEQEIHIRSSEGNP
ncbi:MAG TPA: hypothetical protein VF296_05510, partial [Gallionella sp.]